MHYVYVQYNRKDVDLKKYIQGFPEVQHLLFYMYQYYASQAHAQGDILLKTDFKKLNWIYMFASFPFECRIFKQLKSICTRSKCEKKIVVERLDQI